MKIATFATAAALLLGTVPLMAEEVDTTIDTQIEQIQQAQPQERYRLMNQFKKRLAEMNTEERAAAIAKLQDRVQSRDQIHDPIQDQTQDKTQDRLQDGTGDQLRIHAQDHQFQQMDQMQQSDQLNRTQHMNQVQGSGTASPGTGTGQGGR